MFWHIANRLAVTATGAGTVRLGICKLAPSANSPTVEVLTNIVSATNGEAPPPPLRSAFTVTPVGTPTTTSLTITMANPERLLTPLQASQITFNPSAGIVRGALTGAASPHSLAVTVTSGGQRTMLINHPGVQTAGVAFTPLWQPAPGNPPAFSGLLPWESGPFNPPPQLTAAQILAGTPIQGERQTQTIPFTGAAGWMWFASRWGQPAEVRDMGLDAVVSASAFGNYDVIIDGVSYRVTIMNQVTDLTGGTVVTLRYVFN